MSGAGRAGDGPSAAPDGVGGLPRWRNPWLVAFVAGVVTLSWLHFRMQYHPPPPPDLGTVDTSGWAFVDAGSARQGLGGEVTVVAFVAPDGTSCGSARTAAKMRAIFDSQGVDAAVAAVVFGGPGDAKAWAALEDGLGGALPGAWVGGPTDAASAAELQRLVDAAWGPVAQWRERDPRPLPPVALGPSPECPGPAALAHLALVDAAGRVRGLYPADGWEVQSELLHRTRGLIRDAE